MIQYFGGKQIFKLYHKTGVSQIKIHMLWKLTYNDKDLTFWLPYICNNLFNGCARTFLLRVKCYNLVTFLIRIQFN